MSESVFKREGEKESACHEQMIVNVKQLCMGQSDCLSLSRFLSRSVNSLCLFLRPTICPFQFPLFLSFSFYFFSLFLSIPHTICPFVFESSFLSLSILLSLPLSTLLSLSFQPFLSLSLSSFPSSLQPKN